MKAKRPFTNQDVAELLRGVAAAHELSPQGKFNRFKIAAYQKAADSIEHSTIDLKDVWEEGKLDDVPGVGASIARYLDELFKIGHVRHFEEVSKNLPKAMFPLMRIPGIGAKTAYKLSQKLGIKDEKEAIGQLEKAARAGKIRGIEGFGEDSEADILKSIEEIKGRTGRMLLPFATAIAEEVVTWLKKETSVERVEPLGSLRRQVATVGDVDIAVASKNPEAVISHFTKFPKKARIIEAGSQTSSILMPGGAQVDLMVQPPEAFGALLQHFTGSKHHNIKLREYALKQGLSLSEHGIKLTGKTKSLKLKAKNYNSKLKTYLIETEEGFYQVLGLDFIPPELREDTGEIEAARTGKLPNLVETKDIKGDFHLHSSFPINTSHDEGTATFLEMIKFGEELDYEYIGFSEHNPAASKNTVVKIIDLIKRKNEAIEKINYSREKNENKGIKKVFNGLEIDIQPNGNLAVPDKALEYLDYAIVSVHSTFRQTKSEQTKRVLAALEHPKAKIFGHPTGRRLNHREGIELDWDRVFDFCKKKDKFLEINSWYDRLDLPDTLVREAVKHGIKLVVNTDSHQLDHMRLMRYGISVARRGWAEKKDIINTFSFTELQKELVG